MVSQLPRRVRHLVGQDFNADRLQDCFLRAGIRGWEIYEQRQPSPGQVIGPYSTMVQFHHASCYITELHRVRAKMRPVYAAFKLWRCEKARPYAGTYAALDDLEEFARAAHARMEAGQYKPLDRLFWKIDRLHLPHTPDDGSPRPHVWVKNGQIQNITIA